MKANARCPICQDEISEDLYFCNHCGEPVNRESEFFIRKEEGIFKFGLALVFVPFIPAIAVLITLGPGESTSRAFWITYSIFFGAILIFLLYRAYGGKRPYSEREKFTQELKRREAEGKPPTPELTDEIIVTEADTSLRPICTDCGKNNPPEAVHCMGCGKKLSQSICPECETENLPEAKFCMGCGVKR